MIALSTPPRQASRRVLVALQTLLMASNVAGSVGDEPDARDSSGLFVELDGGAQYDSVVTLDQLDLSSEVGDTALLLDAKIGYSQSFANDIDLDLSYSYSVLDYQDISEVDQRSHIVNAAITKDVGKAAIGLSGVYISSGLDKGSFLELTRISPHISGFVRPGWFARAGVVYSDKVNELSPDRDATAGIGEFDLYHFPPGKPWYVTVGLKYRDESAKAAPFDYTGHTFKARYVYRLSLLDRQARFELAFRHLERDYNAITPSIGEKRFDRRNRTSVELEISLSPRLDARLYYSYSDWESNLDSVDFSQNIVGLRFRYRWDG